MKTLKLGLFALALFSLSTTWYACEKAATCDDGIENGDETGIDCGGICDPCPTCDDGIQNGDEIGVDCGGICPVCPTCDDGVQNGEEEGVDCGGPDCPACYVALQDTKWQSSGTNVAPILVALLDTDSIYAEFNGDFTYLVEQYDTDGAKMESSGTYTQAESSVTDIWTVTVTQTSPTPKVLEGIFQIAGDLMKYEIIQTDPPAGTPPTPEAGFGSSNGGALGDSNVQTFERL